MEPSNPQVLAAIRAMRNLGFHESKVKPELEKLIILFEGNWNRIEEENYIHEEDNPSVDTIFSDEDYLALYAIFYPEYNQQEDNQAVDAIFHEEDNQEGRVEVEAPTLKRLRLTCQDDQWLSRRDAVVDMGKKPKGEDNKALVVGGNKDLVANDSTSSPASVSPLVPYPDDITKGKEKVKIPWVNNSTNNIPPSFYYMRENVVFCDAYLNNSLSHIGNKDYCSTCTGNCVLSSKPCSCSCANKTGGDFAYTAQGVLKEKFLKECIADSRTQKISYCKECPLEISKNDCCVEPCKGHLKRKFIKECCWKCGCGKHCGNRIVQRGITCNLQVFLTSDGKGWGLRTLEELPRGAFVCEFVGEILTLTELREREVHESNKAMLPILLDAEWSSGVVKDNQALCLYAASFGNAARFINHRCLDANLIAIPVEVESPSHYYYHFAFFTSRIIKAHEELTWDYGIDFNKDDQSLELFQCKCGSKFCRSVKRTNGK